MVLVLQRFTVYDRSRQQSVENSLGMTKLLCYLKFRVTSTCTRVGMKVFHNCISYQLLVLYEI